MRWPLGSLPDCFKITGWSYLLLGGLTQPDRCSQNPLEVIAKVFQRQHLAMSGSSGFRVGLYQCLLTDLGS